MSANTRFLNLSDFAKHQANVECKCRCGHKGVLDASKLQRWYFVHRWNDAFGALGFHLRCHVCMGRPIRIRPTPAKPNCPEWMALEGDWARLVKRLRG